MPGILDAAVLAGHVDLMPHLLHTWFHSHWQLAQAECSGFSTFILHKGFPSQTDPCVHSLRLLVGTQGPDSGGLTGSRELGFSKEPSDRLLLLQALRTEGAKKKFLRSAAGRWPRAAGPGSHRGTVLVPAFCGHQKLGDSRRDSVGSYHPEEKAEPGTG